MIKGFKSRTVINHDIKPINPVQCGFQKCPKSYSYGPFMRRYYLLHFITSGKGIIITSNGSYNVTAGQMFVIRPGESTYYEADAADPWSYYWIGFTSDIPLPVSLMTTDVIDMPCLERFFESAFHANEFEHEDAGGAYEYYLSGVIWQILGILKRYEAGKHSSEDYLKIATSLMKAEGRIRISKIAEYIHISPMHLSRLFNEKYGMSPGKYYFQLRMSHAAKMLAAGHTLTNTARSIGYPDAFSFSRAFKKHYTYSPSEYLKRLKASSGETAPQGE